MNNKGKAKRPYMLVRGGAHRCDEPRWYELVAKLDLSIACYTSMGFRNLADDCRLARERALALAGATDRRREAADD